MIDQELVKKEIAEARVRLMLARLYGSLDYFMNDGSHLTGFAKDRLRPHFDELEQHLWPGGIDKFREKQING